VRAMPVVVVEEEWEASGALGGMGVGMSVSPLAEGSLDEAFGLAVGFWGVGSGEAMLEAEGLDGVAHGEGAVAGAIVRIDALDLDAVFVEEGQSGVEESDGTVGALVGEDLGESQTGVIVDGDVQELPTGAADVVALAIAGDAMAGAFDPGQLLDVEVDELAWMSAFVAADGQRRLQRLEPWSVAAQQTGNGGLGELGQTGNLEGWEFAATQGEDPSHPQRVGGSGGTLRT